MERRLAAILAADVVGYSRLMEHDEAGTLAALKSRRREILQPAVSKHHGRIVKLMGDGVLVEFASAVNAVECAAELQRAMDGANSNLPEDRRIVLRVGINVGDVMVEGSGLYGDGVNIAARIESLADPGSVYLSQTVYSQVRGKVPHGFEDLGEQNLKNVTEPVRVYRVRPGGEAAMARPALALPDKPSIAVLPFENRSDDPQQGYFADGVTEDIITELSRFHSLFVIARNSSFQFRGKAVDVKRVGRELGVQYVVEGSVRKIGERIRLTAQLVDCATGNHVWAERYDRDATEIFAVHDDVTQMIAATAAGQVESAGARIAQRKPARNLAAYDCVLRAREIRRAAYSDTSLFMKGALNSARELLERAIGIDPDYARAYAELAWTYMDEWFNLGNGKDLEQAFTCAQTAARLDPTDSTCQRALGMSHLWLRRYEEAALHLETALSINPNDIVAAQNMAVYLEFVGRPSEAKTLVRKAMRLDPYHSVVLRELLGYALYALGQYEEALAELRSFDPLPIWAHPYLAACYAQLDRMDEARAKAAAFLETLLPTSAAPPAGSIAIDRETRLRAITAYIGTYKYQADRDRWFKAMREAGIPV
jgi:TolB-like protein/Tfp pilus assembly protein PilF